MDAGIPHGEELLEDGSDAQLDVVARMRSARRSPRFDRGAAKRLPIDLAVAVRGSSASRTTVDGTMYAGTARGDARASSSRRRRSPRARRRRRASGRRSRDRAWTTAARTSGCSRESSFDLTELDPVAADLHLEVAAPEAFEATVRKTTREIAGSIERRAWIARRRDRRGTRHGEIGTAAVAAREPLAADVEHPRDAGGTGSSASLSTYIACCGWARRSSGAGRSARLDRATTRSVVSVGPYMLKTSRRAGRATPSKSGGIGSPPQSSRTSG